MCFYYYTELNVEECKQKIDEILQIDWSWNSVCRIKGEVSYNSDKFSLKNNIHCRNSVSRIFYGELINKENGTTICGDFSVPFTTQIFFTIWFGFLIIALILAFICSTDVDKLLSVLVMVPIMIAIGAYWISRGLELSKKDEQYVLALIKTNLKAELIPAPN